MGHERLHRRMTVTPFAVPVGTAKSRSEFLLAFKDAVRVAGGRLVCDVGLLHRDFSPSNIMLGAARKNGRRQGILIDLIWRLTSTSCSRGMKLAHQAS